MSWLVFALACASPPGGSAPSEASGDGDPPDDSPDGDDRGSTLVEDPCPADTADSVFCVTLIGTYNRRIDEIRVYRGYTIGIEEPMWEVLRADLHPDRALEPGESAEYPVWDLDRADDGSPRLWDAEIVSGGRVVAQVYNLQFARYADEPWGVP